MDFGFWILKHLLPLVLVILSGSLVHSSPATEEGLCETNAMELHFGTRLQVLSKIELYLGWCGRDFCYKTRRKVAPGSAVETFSEWRRKQICCSGYRESVPDLKPIRCEPICIEECINANCTAPDNCTCLSGYTKNSAYECVPICVNGCVNGKCTGPNTCTCNKGYGTSSLAHLCMPVCEHNCTNGFCISPNKCECFSGYEKDEGSSNLCKPKCAENCLNGFCIAPNNCSCNNNYYLDRENKYKCNPICEDPCVHGYCSSPNVCTCHEGYIQDSEFPKTVCKPSCKGGCKNGVCIAPEKCVCSDGFKSIPILPGECEPLCPAGCDNGICTEPGVCSCARGFEFVHDLHNSKCIPEVKSSSQIANQTTQIVSVTETVVDDLITSPLGESPFSESPLSEYPLTESTLSESPLNVISFSCTTDVFSQVTDTPTDSTNQKCHFVNKLKVNFDCICNRTLECFLPKKGKLDFHQNYDLFCNTTDNVNFTVNVKITETSIDQEYCEWCHCSSLRLFDEKSFHFSACLHKEDVINTLTAGFPIWLIVFCVCLGSVVLITGLVCFLLWKRRRRVHYAVQYKEKDNSRNNKAFERTHELVSDDDSEDET